MQGIFAAQAASSDSPSQTISRVNLALYRRGIESRFVTLMYGALEPDGRLTYCNAGHNPPLVVGPDGRPAARDAAARSSGCSRARRYEEETVTLDAGRLADRLQRRRVRGAVGRAARSTAKSGSSTLRAQATSSMEPQALLEALFADVREFTRGAAQSDDITAMVLQVSG